MATKRVQWGQPLVQYDEWEAPHTSNYNEIDNNYIDYYGDNTPRDDRASMECDDDYEDDRMYDDDFNVNEYDYEHDDRMYDDDEWREFERDYEYDHREYSGLCTGYDDYDDEA